MEHQIPIVSLLGSLILKSDGQSITGISFAEGTERPLAIESVQNKNSCEVLEQCKEQLERYFSGITQVFELPLHPEGTDFQQRVWSELMKIPYGETITYMELDVRLGDPKAIRAVGTANGKNPIPVIIPCHRVIGAGNKLTGYAGGIWRKKLLLELEMNYNPSKLTLF